MGEDGINSGARNFGRLCLTVIPWALGMGMATWFGIYIALHEYHREVLQESRAAQYVGAENRPKSKIKIDMISGCLKIIRADVDGKDLLMYGQNNCGHDYTYGLNWKWQELSPNGTILHSGYENGAFCPGSMRVGDRGECHTTISADDRTETLRVWLEF